VFDLDTAADLGRAVEAPGEVDEREPSEATD
jgi:hypothetical protein